MIVSNADGLDQWSHDVCVVGAGPVGLALAVELAHRNLRVLVVESGSHAASRQNQELGTADIVNPKCHDAMEIAVSRQLGGTSNLWGARCVPLDAVDFLDRDHVPGGSWPLAYESLRPYYERAVELTRSGAARFRVLTKDLTSIDPDFDFDSLERWANEPRSQIIHRDVLEKDPRVRVMLNTTVVDLEIAENDQVRTLKLANTLDGTTITLNSSCVVLAAGGLESTRLLLTLQRQSPTRFGGVDGPLGRNYMGHVIGEIADIVFEDSRLERAFAFRVDGHGSYVRRRFVASPELQVKHKLLNCSFWPVVPPVADARHRSAILSAVYLALAVGPVGRLVVAEAIRRRHIPEHPVSIAQHLGNVLRGLPQAVFFIADFFRRRYFSRERLPGFFVRNPAMRYGLSFHSEQLPISESRVTLTTQNDRLGMPRLKIDYRICEQDADSVVRTHRLLDGWLRRAGWGRLEYRTEESGLVRHIVDTAAHGTHQIGTVRMGTSPRNSVVGANLRCHDVRNLYVLSSAVFPTSGQANPTLTAIALAVRLADHLAEVRRDSPQHHPL